ncbi:MAG: ROK family protein [Microthrixaceae bacterium]|nr:ROK family protein [Microthrixaceae bacterium]
MRSGVVRTAANIDESWIGTDARSLFSEVLGVECHVLNDADAAGVAEMRFGAGVGRRGVVMLVTLGTGIGSAVFTDGVLVPNTELGHLELDGGAAEKYAASSVREDQDLSWRDWGHRVGRYLRMLDDLFSPELFIIGGGVSKRFAKYEEHLREELGNNTEVVAAHTLNQAGIVGAALTAVQAG